MDMAGSIHQLSKKTVGSMIDYCKQKYANKGRLSTVFGAGKLVLILGVFFAALIILPLYFMPSEEEQIESELKSWCTTHHSELTYEACLDEAGL